MSARSHSLNALYHKELSDHIASKRFIIMAFLVLLATAAGIYGTVNGIKDALQSDASFIFLKYFTTGGNNIPSYISFMALIGPFVGLMLGFDAINSEINSGTLNRLLAQPIYRDSVIIGKFLSGATIIALMLLSSGILVGAIGFSLIGIAPSGEELARVAVYLVITILYICLYLAIAMAFSVFCRHSASSALASIALWVVFAIFMSLIAGFVANLLYPVNTDYQQMVNSLKNYTCEQYINRLSPYYLYSEAISTIMNPSVRAVNAVTMSQMVGALSGYLSFGQSLLLVWPHLFALAAVTLLMFTISYIKFMRQEIRGN